MKHNIRRYRLLLALFLCVFVLKSAAQTLYLPHFTTKNGLASNNCYYMLEDRKGYLWIATDAGVSRFDGNNFENFSVDDGLPDNQILQVKEDSKGRIWFLSLSGQLSYFFNGKIYTASNDSHLKRLNLNAIVVSFYEDSQGRIWFGTNKNLIACWNEKSIVKYTSANPKKQFINAFIHEDSKNTIWAYSAQAIHRFVKQDFIALNEENLPLSYKTSINLPDRTMYFLDPKGVLWHQSATDRNALLKVNTDLLANMGYIYGNESELWLSTGDGVHILGFNGTKRHLLPGIDINQVIQDSHGNRWFVTKNGIYRLPRPAEQIFILDQENGLSGNKINGLIKDRENRLWLGMSGAKMDIVQLKNNVVHHIRTIEIPDTKNFYDIRQFALDTSYNSLYFAAENGLGKIVNPGQNEQKISYLKESNRSVFVIKNFSLNTDRRLALALSSGVVIISDRVNNLEFNAINSYKEKNDYFKERSYHVYFDSRNHLWFSNLNGLSEFGDGRLVKYYEYIPILSQRINDIKELPGQIFALATDGYGILYIQHDRVIAHITQKDGLNSNIINKLFVKGNDLWTISRSGVNRILLKDRKAVISTVDHASSLLSDDLNDLYIDDHNAYFATNNGLVYFDYLSNSTIKERLKVYISSITHNKSVMDLDPKQVVFTPGEHHFVFYYSAINFKNQQIIYRYRLKKNADWTETKSRRLELSALEPGNYSFEVSAKTQDSDWSAPAAFTFTIKEHFWQSNTFTGLMIALGAVMLYILAVQVTRKQKNKEQERLLLKNKILMLEQQALQAMMNPHFVFNVMNSIQHYIHTHNTASANKILTGFAKLIRKNLEICTKSYISLEEEIDYLNLYLSLEKNRFGDKLNYRLDVDPELDREESMLPSMLLQPYIENAIWHGIMPKDEGGNVHIDIQRKEESVLEINITDDGVGIDNALAAKKGHHQSKGMTLTRERINLLNKIEAKAIQLYVKQNGESGTTVTILIPLY